MDETKHGLTVLTRLAARRPEQRVRIAQALTGRLATLAPVALDVAIETGDPIGAVLAELVGARPYDDLMRALDARVPAATTALRELALVIVRRRYEAEVYQKTIETREQLIDAAALLKEYAFRLEMVGRLTTARDSLVEVARLLGFLDEADELAVRLKAQTLHTLAGLHADLGDLQAAEDAAIAAVDLHRRGSTTGLEPLLDFASSVNTLGTIQVSRGHAADAERSYREAIDVLEGNAGGDERSRAELARVRHNLAGCS